MSFRKLPVAALVALSSVLLVGCGYQSAKFKRSDTVIETHVAASPLHVQVANGSISVIAGGTDSVTIDAEIKATTQERLDNTRLVVTRTADQTLDIGVAWPDGKRLGSEGCSLTITMPDATLVDLQTSNGRLTVTGVGTEAKLHTSNGRLTVSDVNGPIDAKTSNGRISFTNIGGSISVDTSNGDINMTDVAGPIDADTSNGSIKIRLTDDATGPIVVDSSNGSATLEVGSSFQGNLRLSTSNGKAVVADGVHAESVDVGKRSRTLQFGGEGSSKLSTSNGSITVKPRQSD